MPVQAPSAKRTVLRELIDERGLKYGFVATKLGISPSLLTRLLARERTLSASELMALVDLLGVDAGTFFDGNELILSSDTSTNDDLPPLSSSGRDGGASSAGQEEEVA